MSGGIRPAAEILHTSSPNLSIQAKEFQEYLSIRLYEIGADNRLSPTQAGMALPPMARGLLLARDEVIAALIAIGKGHIRTLRLGCGTLVAEELFRTTCEIYKELVPGVPIRPEHADTVQLVRDVVSGEIDAAIATLPIEHPELCVEEIRRDRLVVCLRADHPLSEKATLRPLDLQGNLRILYQPQHHPEAHARLVELLAETGVQIGEFSSAIHPAEMQRLVRDGYGITPIREGTPLDPTLITRPLMGVNWTVDTALVYHKQHHPETIPVLVRHLKKRLSPTPKQAKTASCDSSQTRKEWTSQTAAADQRKAIGTNVFARLGRANSPFGNSWASILGNVLISGRPVPPESHLRHSNGPRCTETPIEGLPIFAI